MESRGSSPRPGRALTLARVLGVLAVVALIVATAASSKPSAQNPNHVTSPATGDWTAAGRARPATIPAAISKIRHVVIIMQENRSFDSFFGTYPHADGIPGLAGNPGHVPCLPDPHEKCVRPFHDRQDFNRGGPHHVNNSAADVDRGKMDGFIRQQEAALANCHCAPGRPADDVMGYHTGKEVPNYWAYARDFVLQDHMFEPVPSWSLVAHLYMLSLWSAFCTKKNDPHSCRNAVDKPGSPPPFGSRAPIYAWTDLTYLLHKHHVSWRYYIFRGTEPDCESDASLSCAPVTQGPRTLSLWNPLPYFDTVHQDHQLNNIKSVSSFYAAAAKGRLPAVSWIIPNGRVSDHPPSLISRGQTYVTGLINAIMDSPQWKSTAIFLSWDDWSGFYDNVRPPRVDRNGYGLRVPALVISPYAKAGYVDHQTLSFDAYAKFIEDDFLGGQRLNPRTDGRPDPRPDVREHATQLGDLLHDFNFSQSPRKPVMLPVHPKTDLIEP